MSADNNQWHNYDAQLLDSSHTGYVSPCFAPTEKLEANCEELEEMTSHHSVEDNVSTYLLGLKLINAADVNCLEDSSGYCCAQHNQVSLENSI